MDSSTLIAYIKSPEDKEITRFPFLWNDKKWRNLLFFDKYHSTIMAGRPYPKASMEALDLVLKEICKLNKHLEDQEQMILRTAVTTSLLLSAEQISVMLLLRRGLRNNGKYDYWKKMGK
jgi:hypothetical protein